MVGMGYAKGRARREEILTAALEAFSNGGYAGSSILEIAAAVNITRAGLLHHFKSKEELFRAAMNFDPDTALALVEALLASAGQGDLRRTLVEFAERFMAFGRVAMPVMMMSWSNPENQMCAERTSERSTRYQRVLGALSGFFAAEMARGRLRRVEPEVMSRMLIGSLHHFCMIEHFVGGPSGSLSHTQFAEQVVDVLLGTGELPVSGAPPGVEGATS